MIRCIFYIYLSFATKGVRRAILSACIVGVQVYTHIRHQPSLLDLSCFPITCSSLCFTSEATADRSAFALCYCLFTALLRFIFNSQFSILHSPFAILLCILYLQRRPVYFLAPLLSIAAGMHCRNASIPARSCSGSKAFPLATMSMSTLAMSHSTDNAASCVSYRLWDARLRAGSTKAKLP